ncbi:MAG: hypothetical protein ABFD50_09520 [Smithella sp.]
MSEHCYKNPIGGDSDECMFSEEMVHLRDCFRLLWEQHIYWTRMVILGIAFDLPDLEPTTNRLLRNAVGFANLFRHFYRDRAADEFGSLIKDHLTIAAELVNAAKAGNNNAAADAEKRWYANADDIVSFLNHINPVWSVEHMQEMWHEHLALTKAEAVAILTKKYTKSIELFRQIEKAALIMADDFSNGIICQFCLC